MHGKCGLYLLSWFAVNTVFFPLPDLNMVESNLVFISSFTIFTLNPDKCYFLSTKMKIVLVYYILGPVTES